jgi:transketolase
LYPSEDNLERGAYVIYDTDGEPDILIIGSGSELHVALKTKDVLEEKGIKVRVVNFPSIELFEAQGEDYKREVLPEGVKRRVVIEAARGMCWHRYIGSDGLLVSMESFGKSAPGKVLFEHFGFTAEAVAQKIVDRWFSS